MLPMMMIQPTSLLNLLVCFCVHGFLLGVGFLFVASAAITEEANKGQSNRMMYSPRFDHEAVCMYPTDMSRRPTRVSIKEFGGVGDGVTLNTKAFHKAVDFIHSSSGSGNGGVELYIPPGRWLTGNFNLTSHMTLFLEQGSIILGSEEMDQWPVVSPLPSYGRGRELPGGRHISLIYGQNITDVIITGNNGSVDGQGAMWWDLFRSKKLDFTRGGLVEILYSDKIVITNVTFQNSPFWTLHPVYCNNVLIEGVTILAPISSPNTDGVDPDSSSNVCIQDCYISNGDDIVVIKSGWDEYGITNNRPSTNITIRRIIGTTRKSSGIAIGSEMSGGVSNVHVSDIKVGNAMVGVRVKSSPGRGGYVRDIYVSNVEIDTARAGIQLTAFYEDHPDHGYNPNAVPNVERIYLENIVGHNVTYAGMFNGRPNFTFRDVHLFNISMHVNSQENNPAWDCFYVQGTSVSVFPTPCLELQS